MNNDLVVKNGATAIPFGFRLAEIIREIVPDIESHCYQLPLNQINIDSVDLITIRAELENINDEAIPDNKWINFKTLNQIIEYCVNRNETQGSGLKSISNSKTAHCEFITINMPQMAIEALSESWLFKEVGSRHWEMLCHGLKTPSSEIKDSEGNRLYATFVRIRLSGSSSLATFKENDKLEISEKIQRYGAGMYFSRIILANDSAALSCDLMTSFSLRNSSDNTRLVKSQPETLGNDISELSEAPAFSTEYRNVKKGLQYDLTLNHERFEISNNVIFETEYRLNPYYDLNGVGLLYFAAYPIIGDNCEAKYFHDHHPGLGRWETQWFTLARDIFYYGNCNSDDSIIYNLHSVEITEEDVVKTSASLLRKHDGMIIARVFTLKQRTNRNQR